MNRNGSKPLARDPRPKGAQRGVTRRDHWTPRIPLMKLGALAAVVLALVAATFLLTGCGDPCAGHGGTINLNKGLYTCADGTVV